MNKTLAKHFIKSLLLTALLSFGCTVSFANTFVQGGHSGGWVDPDENGHGIFMEVIDNESSPTGLSVVIAWYVYVDGNQAWIVGIGNVVQDGVNQVVNINAFVYEGNDFPPMYDPAQTVEIPWGQMTLEFDGCDKASLTYTSDQPGYGAGEINLVRFTTISGSSCDPDLGEDENNLDDHGNFWQTATAFTHKNLPIQSQRISAVLETGSDVDVFLITVHRRSNLNIFTQGTTNTQGTLYLLEKNMETEVAMDDDSGTPDNFSIDETVDAGTYTIHLEASDLVFGKTGAYLLTVTITQL